MIARRFLVRVGVAVLASVAACNSILGNDDKVLAIDDAGAIESGVGEEGASSGSESSSGGGDDSSGEDGPSGSSSGDDGSSGSSGSGSGGIGGGSSSGGSSGGGSGGGSGSDGGSGGGGDASAPMCATNVLVPTGAVASSLMASTDPASAAVDGNLSTLWESLYADPQWIDVDFGAPVFVERVRILWQHCATNYDLQVSNDASTWTTMTSIVGSTSGSELAPSDWSGAVDTTGLAGVGRYLRVNASVRCLTASGDSIWEMQVYGDTNSGCHP